MAKPAVEFPVSVALGGGRRQEVRVSRSTTWEQFRQKVHVAYGLPTGSVTYTDEEGDKISLDSDAEFQEAVKVGFKLGKLKLCIADNKATESGSKKGGGYYSQLGRAIGQENKLVAAAAAAVLGAGRKPEGPVKQQQVTSRAVGQENKLVAAAAAAVLGAGRKPEGPVKQKATSRGGSSTTTTTPSQDNKLVAAAAAAVLGAGRKPEGPVKQKATSRGSSSTTTPSQDNKLVAAAAAAVLGAGSTSKPEGPVKQKATSRGGSSTPLQDNKLVAAAAAAVLGAGSTSKPVGSSPLAHGPSPQPRRQDKPNPLIAEAEAALRGERRRQLATATSVSATTVTSSTPNLYISTFVRSMSRDKEKKKENESSTRTGATKRQPATTPGTTNHTQGGEGTTVKKPKMVASPKTKYYRRAPRHGEGQKVEGVCRDLDQMKITPVHNRYIDTFVAELRARPITQGTRRRSSSCPRSAEEYSNPYVQGYYHKLAKRRRLNRSSRPNIYVALYHRSMSSDAERVKEEEECPGEVHMDCLPSSESSLPKETGPVHRGVDCDGCGQSIVGVRYKCGNCRDYDLCEKCEAMSDQIHLPEHIFLKVRVPCLWLGRDLTGNMRPLLPYVAYAPRQISEDEVPLLESESETKPTVATTGATTTTGRGRGGESRGVIVRPKDKLREEIKEAKKRRKEEKRRMRGERDEGLDLKQLNNKLEKLQRKKIELEKKAEIVLPEVTFEAPKRTSTDHTPKPKPKYLDCKLVTETCCPQGTSIPPGVKFEKGWILKNTGTKKWKHTALVHQGGYRPLVSEVTVAEVHPGESVEVRVQYPPISSDQDIRIIESSWNLIHKECTPFGPTLTVSVILENPKTTPPASMTPPTETLPLSSNEELLRSIGFLPTDAGVRLPSYPDFEVVPPLTSTEAGGGGGGGGGGEGEEREDSVRSTGTFIMVENPGAEVMSISSIDSLPLTSSGAPLLPPPPGAGGEPAEESDDGESDKESDDSDEGSSESEEDFVVVIPDCFNLNIPLSASNTPMTQSRDDFEFLNTTSSHDTPGTTVDEIQQLTHEQPPLSTHAQTPISVPSQPPVSVPSTELEEEKHMAPSASDDTPITKGSSPQMKDRQSFVPRRVTLRGVKDARLRNPLTMATGLVNTVTDLVEGLTLSPATARKNTRGGGGGGGDGEEKDGRKEEPQREEEEEDTFVDCPEPSSVHAATGSPSSSLYPSWQHCLPSNVTSWLQESHDPTFDRSTSHNEEVNQLLQKQWKSPELPDDPVDRLVAMGFANRELNRQLLEKHNFELQPVTNELLDVQNSGRGHWASMRH